LPAKNIPPVFYFLLPQLFPGGKPVSGVDALVHFSSVLSLSTRLKKAELTASNVRLVASPGE